MKETQRDVTKTDKLFNFVENSYHKIYEKDSSVASSEQALIQILIMLGAVQFYLITSYEFGDIYSWGDWGFLIPTTLSVISLVISGGFWAKSYLQIKKFNLFDYSKIDSLLTDYKKEDTENTLQSVFCDCLKVNQPIIVKKLNFLFYAKMFMAISVAFLFIEAILYNV